MLLPVLAAAACTLVPAYDQGIDDSAQKLRTDFLRFVVERQQQIDTPQGAYAANAHTYADLLSQIGAIQLRAADQPGGLSCDQATAIVARVHPGTPSFTPAPLPASDGANDSCIAVLARLAARQVELMQADDARRCAAIPPSRSCQDLFGRESMSAMVASVHAAPASVPSLAEASASSPFVRAVLVSIDQLAGAEQDLKAAQR